MASSTLALGPTSYELQEQTISSIDNSNKTSEDKSSESIEKGNDFSYEINRVPSVEEGEVLMASDEPFPQDPNAEEEQQFTVRAVLVGCVLGGVIAASK